MGQLLRNDGSPEAVRFADIYILYAGPNFRIQVIRPLGFCSVAVITSDSDLPEFNPAYDISGDPGSIPGKTFPFANSGASFLSIWCCCPDAEGA